VVITEDGIEKKKELRLTITAFHALCMGSHKMCITVN